MEEFRKMRRYAQELDHEACLEMIGRATSGVLSVIGEGGYPYGIPMSFAYVDGGDADDIGRFYFHCATTGHKIDALRACDKACFTIVDMDDVVADEFTTYFKSVVAFGRVKIIESEDEKRRTIRILTDKYSPDESEEKKTDEIDRKMPAFVMLEFKVEHMTGKEAIELVRKRKKYK